MLSNIPATAWHHKYKTIFVIVIFYLGKKAWDIYITWIKPFMEMTKMMKGETTPKIDGNIKLNTQL